MKTLLVLVALCSVAAADVHTNKSAKLSFDAPKTYKLDDQDTQSKGQSEDKAVALALWIVDSGDPDKATHDVAMQFYTMIGSLQWGKPKADKVNGLAAQWIDGTGLTGGNHKVDLHLVLVGPTATKKYAILVAIVDDKQDAAHKAEVTAILKSLKPAK